MYPILTIIANGLLTFLLVGSCSLPALPETTSVSDTTRQSVSATLMELPAYGDEEDIILYDGFTSSYNHVTLVPNWVAYELIAEELDGSYNTKSSNFSRDPNVRNPQASREDYSHSGWDRGHMAPKADMRWSERAYWQSHYFPNICPQNHGNNSGDWNKLERKVRQWGRQYGRVWVVCGPLFEKGEYGTIGNAKVHVPDYFFKALLIYDGGHYSAVAYLMHNDGRRHKLQDYVCTVNELESRIGRDLFPTLNDSIEEAVEDTIDWPHWQ